MLPLSKTIAQYKQGSFDKQTFIQTMYNEHRAFWLCKLSSSNQYKKNRNRKLTSYYDLPWSWSSDSLRGKRFPDSTSRNTQLSWLWKIWIRYDGKSYLWWSKFLWYRSKYLMVFHKYCCFTKIIKYILLWADPKNLCKSSTEYCT